MKSFLPRLFFSYSSSCDDGDIGTYNCDPCPLVDSENGGVRSIFFVKKSALATLLAAPTLEATWTGLIASGDIVIVPMTRGSFDPGTPAELPGFGDNKISYGPRTMTLNWSDPNYKYNYAFYNGLTKLSNYVPGYRTSSLVHIFDKTASLVGSDPVEEDIDTRVVWNGVASVISDNLPSKHDASNLSDVFSCN
jgi:hypothetical protein